MTIDPIALVVFIAWMLCGISAPYLMARMLVLPERIEVVCRLLSLVLGPPALLLIVLAGIRDGVLESVRMASEAAERRKLRKVAMYNTDGDRVTDPGLGAGASGEAINKAKKIIYGAFDKNASDIFIDPDTDGRYVVRMRINGSLVKVMDIGSNIGPRVVNAFKVISNMDISEHRRPQDGSCSVAFNDVRHFCRLATVGVYGGEKLSIRVLGNNDAPMKLDEFGLSADELRTLKRVIGMPSGMVLMCGPTGSGKTTTLYAMLRSIDYTLKNVISIEDPIETLMPDIGQMEVNTKAGITFAQLLRNSLRQNPDIICLGEVRDEETAAIAMQAAQTGHLIIATLHSNDNLGTIDRLQNLGVPPRSIASTLHAVISQRLVRTLCPHCSEPAMLPEEYAEYFRLAGFPTAGVRAAVGCPKCNDTGYGGRKALFDILVVDDELRSMLEQEHATVSSVKAFLEGRHGGSMLAYRGLELVSRGETTISEVERITADIK